MTALYQKPSRYFVGKHRFQGIPASVLKLIALVIMFCDHASVACFGTGMTFLRAVGRLGFPIFAFFIAEGASRTKSIPKYLARLYLFAFISEVPFDMVLEGTPFSLNHQNVYFTLILGLCSVWAIRELSKKKLALLGIFPVALACVIAVLIKCDYDATGVLCVVLFYLAQRAPRKTQWLCYTGICLGLMLVWCNNELCLNAVEFYSVFAVPLLCLYNGDKGFYINKYFFYAFYPAHLLILGLIRIFIVK